MDQQADLSQVSPNDRELHDFRYVTLVDPNAFEGETTQWLWDRVKTQDYAFDDLSRDNPTSFCLALLAQQTAHFFLGDPAKPSGWGMVKNLWEKSNPDVHFLIWDKEFPISKIKAAAREVLDWVFKQFECNRVTAFIPTFNPEAKRLAILLRFQYEGTLRESVCSHGRWHHTEVFGLLKKDFYTKVV